MKLHFEPDLETLPTEVATTYELVVDAQGFAPGDTLTAKLLCRGVDDCEWSDLSGRHIGPEEIPELRGEGLQGQTITAP